MSSAAIELAQKLNGETTATPLVVAKNATGGKGLALTPSGTIPTNVPVTALRMLAADPAAPGSGEFWFRTDTNQLCVQNGALTKRITLT